MSRKRLRAISARLLVSPHSILAAVSSPARPLSAEVRMWYRQRIFSRCRGPVGDRGAVFDQFAAIAGQTRQVVRDASESEGGQVVVATSDASDLNRVHLMALGAVAAPSPCRRSHLRGTSTVGTSSRNQRCGGAAVVCVALGGWHTRWQCERRQRTPRLTQALAVGSGSRTRTSCGGSRHPR